MRNLLLGKEGRARVVHNRGSEWSGDFKPRVNPAEKVTFERRAKEVREQDGSLQVI